MAQKDNLPVIRIDATHTGTTQEEGVKMGEERFNGLAAQVELTEEVRAILIHNLAVEYGLMNGTQDIVKHIFFRDRTSPEPCQCKHASATHHRRRFPEVRRP